MNGAPGLARNPSARARRAGSRGRKAEGAARKAFCLAARALRLVRKAKSLAPPAQSLVPKAACLAPRSQSLAGNAQSLAGKAKSLGCQGAEPCPQGFLPCAQGEKPRDACWVLWRRKAVSRPPGAAAQAGLRGASPRAAGAGRVCKPDRGTNSPANPCSSNARNEFSRVTRRAHVGRLKSPLKGRPMRESVSGGRSPFLTWGKRGGATP